MSSLPDVLCAGAMLGGLLALTGSWSRGARADRIPHLAVGAVASVGTGAMSRFSGRPALAVGIALLAGAACGGVLERAERRLEGGRFPLAADVAGLALVLGLAALLAPAPLGSSLGPGSAGSWLGAASARGVAPALLPAAAGVALAAALARAPAARLPSLARWSLAGAGSAGLGALLIWVSGASPGRAAPLALALAAAVAALLGGRPLAAVPAGVVLGMAAALVLGAA